LILGPAGRCAWAVLLLAVAPLAAQAPLKTLVEGVTGKALDNVQEALVLPRGLVRDGEVDRLWLERFARQAEPQVRSALEPFGYYQAKVSIGLEGQGAATLLRVRIEPGEPVRVAEARVSLTGPGAQEPALAEQVAAFPLRQGDVLLQPAYEQARDALKARAKALGYLKAEFAEHEIRITRSSSSAVIALVLETGPKYHFRDISFSGAPDYPDGFLARYLEFKPGDVFSYAKLGEAQLNLTHSERFKDVVLAPEIPEAAEDGVPVRVQVKQTPRRTLRTGVGYGTDTGARFTARYRDLNMLHRGHEFYSNLFVSEKLQGLESGYIWPSDPGFRSSTSLSLNLQDDAPDTYTSKVIALELARNHSFGARTQGTAYFKLQQERYTTSDESSLSRLVIPGVRWSTDHYDDLMRPTRGYHFAADLRAILQPLSLNSQMAQLLAETIKIIPLPGRLTLQTRLKAAATWSKSGDAAVLPPTLRFYAGGSTSVRGYDYKSLGPRDADGAVVGGKDLLAGTVELERALGAKWGVSVFADAGNAFDSWQDFSLYQSAGVGLHYHSPVGSMNLSLARQLKVEDPGYRINFTVGFSL